MARCAIGITAAALVLLFSGTFLYAQNDPSHKPSDPRADAVRDFNEQYKAITEERAKKRADKKKRRAEEKRKAEERAMAIVNGQASNAEGVRARDEKLARDKQKVLRGNEAPERPAAKPVKRLVIVNAADTDLEMSNLLWLDSDGKRREPSTDGSWALGRGDAGVIRARVGQGLQEVISTAFRFTVSGPGGQLTVTAHASQTPIAIERANGGGYTWRTVEAAEIMLENQTSDDVIVEKLSWDDVEGQSHEWTKPFTLKSGLSASVTDDSGPIEGINFEVRVRGSAGQTSAVVCPQQPFVCLTVHRNGNSYKITAGKFPPAMLVQLRTGEQLTGWIEDEYGDYIVFLVATSPDAQRFCRMRIDIDAMKWFRDGADAFDISFDTDTRRIVVRHKPGAYPPVTPKFYEEYDDVARAGRTVRIDSEYLEASLRELEREDRAIGAGLAMLAAGAKAYSEREREREGLTARRRDLQLSLNRIESRKAGAYDIYVTNHTDGNVTFDILTYDDASGNLKPGREMVVGPSKTVSTGFRGRSVDAVFQSGGGRRLPANKKEYDGDRLVYVIGSPRRMVARSDAATRAILQQRLAEQQRYYNFGRTPQPYYPNPYGGVTPARQQEFNRKLKKFGDNVKALVVGGHQVLKATAPLVTGADTSGGGSSASPGTSRVDTQRVDVYMTYPNGRRPGDAFDVRIDPDAFAHTYTVKQRNGHFVVNVRPWGSFWISYGGKKWKEEVRGRTEIHTTIR